MNVIIPMKGIIPSSIIIIVIPIGMIIKMPICLNSKYETIIIATIVTNNTITPTIPTISNPNIENAKNSKKPTIVKEMPTAINAIGIIISRIKARIHAEV